MKQVQYKLQNYNNYLVNSVDADDLVLQHGDNTHVFPAVMGLTSILHHGQTHDEKSVNIYHLNLQEILNIYLYILLFLNTELVQSIEIHPCGWQGAVHPIWLIRCSCTLSREYWMARNRYSQLLFTGEDHLCANLRAQEQMTNMTSQCQYFTFAWRHKYTVVTSQC